MQFPEQNVNIYGRSFFGNGRNRDMPPLGMERRRRQNPLRGYLGCLTLLLCLVGISGLASALFGFPLITGPTVIQVSSHPTLIVESETYTDSVINKPVIRIHTGEQNGQILIQSHRLLGLPFGFAEKYWESSDHETVIYDYSSMPRATGIFDITVPAQTNLKIDTNSWGVQVEGMTGQMVLTSNGGDLTVTNCHLSAPSLFRDNSGAISFQGSLEGNGAFQFNDNGGPITATLPQNANVHIDAVTNSGTMTSHVPQLRVQSNYNGFELHGNIGTTPDAGLTLSNNSGPIVINEQGGN